MSSKCNTSSVVFAQLRRIAKAEYKSLAFRPKTATSSHKPITNPEIIMSSIPSAECAIIVKLNRRRWAVVYQYTPHGAGRTGYWCEDAFSGWGTSQRSAQRAIGDCSWPKTYETKRAARAEAEWNAGEVIG
jgi:hypothetical protein